MRVPISAQCFLVFALYTAQIMLICSGKNGAVNSKYDYEILSLDEYASVAGTRNVQGKVLLNCSFDTGWCGFHNLKRQDEFDWTLASGVTPSYGTGPNHDISGKGSYIYIEASAPRRDGDTARVTSPIFPPMVYCLQFGFHAFGSDIGALIVHKKSLDNKKETILKVDQNFGKKWHHVIMTLACPSRFVIEFEGVRGRGYTGDIALDNISLTEGKCETTTRNKTDSCGLGYPGFANAIRGSQAFHAWPWLVWLSPIGQSQPSCTAVQVNRDWLLTTSDCVRKFGNKGITPSKVYQSKRRNVLNIKERFPNTSSHAVLLQLNMSYISNGVVDKVCLPSIIPLQNRITNCYLLAFANLGHGKSFRELPATVLPSTECKRGNMPLTAFKTNRDLTAQLCLQVNGLSGLSHNLRYSGYLVCKNDITDRWILHAMGWISLSDFKQNILVMSRVSFDVDWINNVIKATILSPNVPANPLPTTSLLRASNFKGFQIMEKISKECLTFQSDVQKFTYRSCNAFDTNQRFLWTKEDQLITLRTNSCIAATNFHFLHVDPCFASRRSQKWICKGNSVFNVYLNGYITLKSNQYSSFVRLNRAQELIGRFVIAGTHDDLCTLRPTVKDVLRCDFNLHRMCGFDGTDSYARFMWRVPRYGSNNYKKFPPLVSTDKYFTVVRRSVRGTRTAALRSPFFNGQRCAEFQMSLQGSVHDQLKIYKAGSGERKLVFQRNAGNDRIWRSYRVTIVPTACEAYQVVFEVVISNFRQFNVAVRDIVVSPGACFSPKEPTDGECLKGWRFVGGRCMYFHDTKATWREASAVCHIVDAELASDTAARKFIPRGRSAWFGVRSCPTGRLYSVQGVPYKDAKLLTTPACLLAQKPRNGATIYRSSQCDLKLPFVCQKDAKTTKDTCGWRNISASYDRQWPWHVLIVVYERCACGGTLVAPGYVVTSTLCLSRVWLKVIKLFFPSSRKVIKNITGVINHPLSGIKSGDNDISIVKFEGAAPSVHFPCIKQMTPYWIDDVNFLKDKRCAVLGWGTFKGSQKTCGPENYAIHEVKVVDRNECKEYYGAYMITDRMICAKAAKYDSAVSCLGDTGGPLVCDIAGAWTLVGVTSWGIGCSPTRKYGIYTDIGSMKPWVDLVLRNN